MLGVCVAACVTTPTGHSRIAAPASNAVAACVAGSAAVGAVATAAAARPVAAASSYLVASVAGYCCRRGCLHRWPHPTGDGARLGAAEVLRRHLTYEDGWHLPDGSPLLGRLLHLLHVVCWLALFQPIYPLLELALYPLDAAAFWFYYPKARGAGLIVDSRALRRGGKRGNGAQIFRLDWHRFELNVGKKYPAPNPGHHPPSVLCNLPHVDLPQRRPGIRHWPWRQHTTRLKWFLPRPPRSSSEAKESTT